MPYLPDELQLSVGPVDGVASESMGDCVSAVGSSPFCVPLVAADASVDVSPKVTPVPVPDVGDVSVFVVLCDTVTELLDCDGSLRSGLTSVTAEGDVASLGVAETFDVNIDRFFKSVFADDKVTLTVLGEWAVVAFRDAVKSPPVTPVRGSVLGNTREETVVPITELRVLLLSVDFVDVLAPPVVL